MNNQHIALIVYSLERGGGAEKVVSELSLQFAALQHQVTVIVFDNAASHYEHGGTLLNLDLPSRTDSGFIGRIRLLLKRRRALKQVFVSQQFDRIIAVMESAAFPAILTGYKVIISNHCNPEIYFTRLEWWLAQLLYPKALKVVAVSQKAAAIFKRSLGLRHSIFIHNPLNLERINNLATDPMDLAVPGNFLLAVSRLEPQKRLDRLLEAFANSQYHQEVYLLILGEGRLRAALEHQVESLGLTGRVLMPGTVTNPYPYMRAARFMLMSSDHEGFPMALIESLAVGTPVVSTDCETGPREIVHHGENGLLVPVSAEGLSAAIDRLLADPILLSQLQYGAKPSVQHLATERIAAEWLAL